MAGSCPDQSNRRVALVEGLPRCLALRWQPTLVAEHGIDHKDIECIPLSINGMLEDVLTYDDPQTEAEAKFSKTYPVAAATVFDYVGIETFEPETIRTPAIQRVRELIDYERDPDLGKDTHQVTVTLGDEGRRVLPGDGYSSASQA